MTLKSSDRGAVVRLYITQSYTDLMFCNNPKAYAMGTSFMLTADPPTVTS